MTLLTVMGYIWLISLICCLIIFSIAIANALIYYRIKRGIGCLILAYMRLLVTFLIPILNTIILFSLIRLFKTFNVNVFNMVYLLYGPFKDRK